jgi:hypothetical protein
MGRNVKRRWRSGGRGERREEERRRGEEGGWGRRTESLTGNGIPRTA